MLLAYCRGQLQPTGKITGFVHTLVNVEKSPPTFQTYQIGVLRVVIFRVSQKLLLILFLD